MIFFQEALLWIVVGIILGLVAIFLLRGGISLKNDKRKKKSEEKRPIRYVEVYGPFRCRKSIFSLNLEERETPYQAGILKSFDLIPDELRKRWGREEQERARRERNAEKCEDCFFRKLFYGDAHQVEGCPYCSFDPDADLNDCIKKVSESETCLHRITMEEVNEMARKKTASKED